jgi:ABC-2 type transporter
LVQIKPAVEIFSAILVPIDIPIIKREHFNRWYSSGAYYLSLIVSDAPVIVACGVIYTMIIYIMTDQPLEMFRFTSFVLIGILTSFTAQAWGLFMGSMFDITVSATSKSF